MKKYVIIGCLWFMSVTFLLTCNAKTEIDFQINYDSQTKETYKVKREIQKIYSNLVSGIHEESYVLMVLHNKERFAYKKNMKVAWKHNMLIITEGDGKGDQIKGVLEATSMCVPKVQPRSIFRDIFG